MVALQANWAICFLSQVLFQQKGPRFFFWRQTKQNFAKFYSLKTTKGTYDPTQQILAFEAVNKF